MKKVRNLIIGGMTAATLLVAAAPAATTSLMANAVGTPGKPIYAVSNTGSAAGQANRSTTGSVNKSTHDNWVWIWD